MRAVILEAPAALRVVECEAPSPGPGEVLLEVLACGVCRTDLHILDGELPPPQYPRILGHQIVGRVTATGPACDRFAGGERVGVPWLGSSCGACSYCLYGRENLCDEARFTGYHRDGGFAELAVADQRYCFDLPAGMTDRQVAPLLCAGLIGYRTLRFAGDAETIGLYGFGAAAHILAQILRHQGRRFLAFTRSGDEEAQSFARRLGAAWAGRSQDPSPEPLDAALLFAPAGELVPKALRDVRKGGRVICGGIHMSDIPSFSYEILWGERSVCSVANLTRTDGEELLALASRIPIETEVTAYPLEAAPEALDDLRSGQVRGAAVLVTDNEERRSAEPLSSLRL
jgi:propanol-preferring alcohol dehydrogenase